MTQMGVRRDKAALSSGCKPHPAIRSSRKQPEQAWKPTLIPRGQCSRAVLDMLRHADRPMAAREIATQLAARYQVDTGNTDAMKALVAKVRKYPHATEGTRERDAGGSEGVDGGERGLAPRPPFAILDGANQARKQLSGCRKSDCGVFR
jgi:hypothetical protein